MADDRGFLEGTLGGSILKSRTENPTEKLMIVEEEEDEKRLRTSIGIDHQQNEQYKLSHEDSVSSISIGALKEEMLMDEKSEEPWRFIK